MSCKQCGPRSDTHSVASDLCLHCLLRPVCPNNKVYNGKASYVHLCDFRWQKLLADSEERKQTLLRLQEQYRNIEDLYLAFAKKASAFNSWFENAEEDLTDPVRCNSVEEIKVSSIIRNIISNKGNCLNSSSCNTCRTSQGAWKMKSLVMM